VKVPVTEVWCREVDESQLLADVDGSCSGPEPVVAFVGAYNAGKTSLIRRLLHELGLPVPAELSVASDPTTFDALDVPGGAMIFRDTPGLGSGKDLHNARALDAAVSADALVVMMTPQLLSAADTDAWDLLTGEAWGREAPSEETGWDLLVINRFDTAGADPDTELDAHRALAARKLTELNASLRGRGAGHGRDALVIASDPYGLVADSPGCRDSYREGGGWDGIPELLAWLEGLLPLAADLRAQLGIRIRGRALLLKAKLLAETLPGLQASASGTALRRHAIGTHQRQMERLWRQAESDRQQLLHDAIGLDAVAAAAPDRASLLRDRLQQLLAAWTDGLADQLRALTQASPELHTIEEAPSASPVDMPNLDAHYGRIKDPLVEALTKLRDNAEQVKATAEAFRALGGAFPAMARIGGILGSDVVDAAVSAATLFLNVTQAEEQALREAAIAQRDLFTSLAVQASDAAITELRDWHRRYNEVNQRLAEDLAIEHEAASATINQGQSDLGAIKSLLASIPG